MAQGYYTLQEAAEFLKMPVDELRQLAQKNQIRSFQDRGTLRFRVQDIQEQGRRRGVASDVDQPLMPPPPSNPLLSPRGPKTNKMTSMQSDDVFDFSLQVNDEQVDIGREGGVAGSKPSSKSDRRHSSPRPLPGSDSDVRLIPDDELALHMGSDNDIRLIHPDSDVKLPSSASRKNQGMPETPPVQPRSGSVPRSSTKPKSGKLVPGPSGKLAGGPSGKLVPGPSGKLVPGPSGKLVPGPSGKLVGGPSGKLVVGPSGKLVGGPSGKIVGGASGKYIPGASGKLAGKSPLQQSKSRFGPPTPGSDSGVRLVPFDSDSDVKIVGASDEVNLGVAPQGPTYSDIRLQTMGPPAPSASAEAMLLTEEINLDEEIRKQEEALAQKPPQAKVKIKSKVSPFELEEPAALVPESTVPAVPEPSSDFDLAQPEPKAPSDSSDFELQAPPEEKTDSSDFDLVPATDGSVVVEGQAGDDFSLELPEENEMALGGSDGGQELKGPTSGINLSEPVDAGLSLEQGGDAESSDLGFEISLDAGDTPKPVQADSSADGTDSSQFEINLEDSSGEAAALEPEGGGDSDFELNTEDSSGEAAALSTEEAPSDSEFELTLDPNDSSSSTEANAPPDSGEVGGDSSEFELTLDDSGDLSDGQPAEASAEESNKDIFETDFEVPGLDESGSEVAALDTDLESSDFDIQVEDESGSQVVALDEEEGQVDDAAATTAAPGPGADLAGEEEIPDFDQLSGEEEPVEEMEVEEAGTLAGPAREVYRPLRPAPWGAVPTIFMLPCVIVMVLVGILGFELIQNATGYRPPGFLTKTLAELMSLKMK